MLLDGSENSQLVPELLKGRQRHRGIADEARKWIKMVLMSRKETMSPISDHLNSTKNQDGQYEMQ